jgi:hypothetical protein
MIIPMGELSVKLIEVRAIGQIFYDQPTHYGLLNKRNRLKRATLISHKNWCNLTIFASLTDVVSGGQSKLLRHLEAFGNSV